MDHVPDMVDCYIQSIYFSQDLKNNQPIKSHLREWLFPTTVMPLQRFIKGHKIGNALFLPDEIHPLKSPIYVAFSGKDRLAHNISYIEFPTNQERQKVVLEGIYRSNMDGKEYGGPNAFKYALSELSDNIYQHSTFEHAWIMIQRFNSEQFLEVCLLDDGISIPGNYEKNNTPFKNDVNAILQAVNGKSTKKEHERGYGLPSVINMIIKGLKGEFLLVSRTGGLALKNEQKRGYNLSSLSPLSGTLISFRIPYNYNSIDIYPYMEAREEIIL